MTTRKFQSYRAVMNSFIISISICAFTANFPGAFAQNEYKNCPGPLKFYQDLGCTPVYESPTDKCPNRFNCRSIDNRLADKCYLGGKEYNPQEELPEDDKNACDRCTCMKKENFSGFTCAIVDCYRPNLQSGCYQQRNATQCCPGFSVICPTNPADVPTCQVDGKIYKDGEYFEPSSEPDKRCFCGPNYKGKNIAPFCTVKPKSECRTEVRYSRQVYSRCAPVYEADQSPQTSCTLKFRCQTQSDRVIQIDGPKAQGPTCRFGDLVMNYGDELNMGDAVNSKCVKCRCEVSPTPTCQRLPRDKCQ
uniref:KCP protein n=1 Tax=Fopius arisanus TaxID=64838 RepID=A0A0C9QR92_9HYME